jgi:predicted SAM-dependent methyltransferase
MFKAAVRKILATQPEPLQAAARSLWHEVQVAWQVRASRGDFQKLRGRTDLKVHLGCGPELKDGWINLDLNLNQNVPQVTGLSPDTTYIPYDLRLGSLPLDDASCEFFYSSHFLEHLEYREGVRLIRDCYRALKPGGTFRAALPDFRKMFRAYVDQNHQYFDLISILDWLPDREPETVSLADQVNLGVYQWGEHKCIYDEDKLCLVLRHIGFSSAQAAPYREGLDPSHELRQKYSFYVEAVK